MAAKGRPREPIGFMAGCTDENAVSHMGKSGSLKGLAPPRAKLGNNGGGLQGLKQPLGGGGLAAETLVHMKTPRSEKPLGVYIDPSSSPLGKSGGMRIRKPRLALQNITNATPRHSNAPSGLSVGKEQKMSVQESQVLVPTAVATTSEVSKISKARAAPSKSHLPPARLANKVIKKEPLPNSSLEQPKASSTLKANVQPQDDTAWIRELAEKYAAEGDGYETCGLTSDELQLLVEKREAEEIKAKVDQLLNVRIPLPSLLFSSEKAFRGSPPSPVYSTPQLPGDSHDEDWISGLNSISMDETAFTWLDQDFSDLLVS